jgi:hypothetical protein
VDEFPDNQVERIDALFVQSAAWFTSMHGAITLHGLTASTVYFAERPRREIGHLPSRRFVDLWAADVNSFAVDPPNAVISFLDEEDEGHGDAVVVLHDPRLEGDELTYRVEVLEGRLPKESGPCALFIDVFGRPLSPVSVAGAHHRPGRGMRDPPRS